MLRYGASESLETWRESGYVDGLKQDYRLILIDARGHGASDKPHDPEAYTLQQRVGDVIAVLDDLKLRQVHYFGYSLGGWSGFGMAKYAPERLHSLIIGGAQPYGQSFDTLCQIFRKGSEAWVAVGEELTGPLFSPERRARWLKNDVQALVALYTQDKERPDISDLLPTMTMPCLLFAGDADPIYFLVKRCATELPNASFFPVPKLNHFETAWRGDLVLPHLSKFLAKVEQDIPLRQVAL